MNIDFKNVNHRKDYLSVDKLTAISAEGQLFEVGNIVETDDSELGASTITHFTLDEESCDVKAHTEKGWNRICFLYVVEQFKSSNIMKNIHILPTAKEFIRSDKGDNLYIISDGDESNIAEIMIEFAKLHVEAALTEASKTPKWKEQITMQGLQVTIIKSSILNAYPLTNIK